ncbi:MAG: DUF433 domain-containing protein [Bacteroidetes bacterium]|nr:DUF433 domain-containing protein [Bacteroidota bacterium]MBU1679687.1 DUF433 domain-containing protein [Bacteroidota bacterium]
MENTTLLNRIEVDTKIMFGKPVIRGSRLTVELILEKLANGYTDEQVIEAFPFLVVEDIRASLLYAAKVISLEENFAA